jgi:hypothetical protein
MLRSILGCIAAMVCVSFSFGHEGHDHGAHHKKQQKKGDVVLTSIAIAPTATKEVDGQGDWKFKYRPDLSSVPVPEANLLAAHGGFAVDLKAPISNQPTYFGLPGVGLLKISHDLQEIKVVGGDKDLFNGETEPHKALNYHNTSVVYNGDELLLGLPGNNSGKIWIVTPEGKLRNTFGAPPESNGAGPTDLVQLPDRTMIVTYGYGNKRLYSADPLSGEVGQGVWNPGSFGGPGPRKQLGVFTTPHGVALWPTRDSIAVADREYGRIQRLSFTGEPLDVWDLKVPGSLFDSKQWSNPCDVDFSPDGEVAVIGNLNGVNGANATFQIVDVRTGQLLSTVCPADLGVPNSRHIHNAAFRYVDDRGKYVLCLFWNPGGYAVFEKVSE